MVILKKLNGLVKNVVMKKSDDGKKCQECGRDYFIWEEGYDKLERKLCGHCSYKIKNLKKSDDGKTI